MKLEVLTNEVNARTVEENGKEYIVAPIRFIKNMELDKGYVPDKEIRDATMRWDGTPIVSDHPKDGFGHFVSVDAGDKDVIGELREPQTIVTNDTVTMGEVWIETDTVGDDEDKQVIESLQDDETLSVSSAYVGEVLPPGKYDGEHREQVRGNLQPDHVAVFPDKEGRCSVADGCFVGDDAELGENEVMVNISPDDPGNSGEGLVVNRETARRPNFEGIQEDWSDPSFSDYVDALGIDAEQVRDLNSNQKRVIADMSLMGDPRADTFDSLAVFPVVDPETRSLSERALDSVLGEGGESVNVSDRGLASARAQADSLLGEEFSEQSRNVGIRGRMKEMEEKLSSLIKGEKTNMKRTEELVNNHGFDEENLPSEDTECFDKIYEGITANEDDGDDGDSGSEVQDTPDSGDSGSTGSDQDTQTPSMDKDDMKDALSETFDEKGVLTEDNITEKIDLGEQVAEAMATNRKREEKEEIVDSLIANSDDYDDEDKEELLDSPKKVLSNLLDKEKDEKKSADFSAVRGGSANMSEDNDVDTDSFVLNMNEVEGDD